MNNSRREQLVKEIEDVYHDVLFKDGFVDRVSGLIKDSNKKFATFPAIGEKYGLEKKIMIVGLDIGSDETEGRYQTINERSDSIQSVHANMNHHMGGTYFTALFLLMNHKNEYKTFFEKVKFSTIFKTIIKKNINSLPKDNPLNYIVFTNFHKFVTVNRYNKLGSQDRSLIDKEKEVKLFVKEIEILNPDIVFFQSTSFNHILKNEDIRRSLKNKEVYIGYHPSKRLSRLKYPGYYFSEEFVKKNSL